MDLLNRLLIIKTESYNREETAAILQIRADVEGVKLEQSGLDALTEIGTAASLRHVMTIAVFVFIKLVECDFWLLFLCCRYAVQLITPAKLHARIQGVEAVGPDSVETMQGLFLDAKTSARILAEKKDAYMK